MRTKTLFSTRLARTPLHRALRALHRALGRRLDRIDNWGDANPATNGEYRLLQRAAPSLRLVLDIGANLGDWTAELLAASPRCFVHAFEANPRTFANLVRRFAGMSNVMLHPIGVGERAGCLTFHDCGENSGLSSFVSRTKTISVNAERHVEVPVTTVDDFCREQGIDQLEFVKIDTEGFEGPILRGMVDSLRKQRVPAVQFEYGGTWLDAGESLAGTRSLLESHSYTLCRLHPDGVEPIAYDPCVHEAYKYANYLAIASLEVLERWRVPLLRP